MIETSRLILRQWTENDIAPFAAINRNEQVMEYFPHRLSYDETCDFYRRITDEFADSGFGLYAVELKETKEFIGYVGFHRFNFEACFSPGTEIGWRISPEYWNRGYATEAAKACLNYARHENLFDRLYSFTAVCNRRSERVMQKIGMKYVRDFLHPALPDNHPLQKHVLYSIEIKMTPD